MKKKNLISLVVAGVLVCSMMTGCGNTEPTTGDIPVAEESTQVAEVEGTVEVAEPTTEETVETETTETVGTTEAVVDDFLNQNGLVITPCGTTTVQLAIGMMDNLTDDVKDFTVDTSIESYGEGEDGVQEVFVVKVPAYSEEGYTYNISAFDRYTGRSFESASFDLADGSASQTGVIIDVNGKEYECSLYADVVGNEDGSSTMILEVHHPKEYDGVVFMFGQMTKTQSTAYDNIDFSSEFSIADYADVFIDGQTFFTVSGK